MYLYEFEAKKVFKNFGIPLVEGDIATSPEEAAKVFETIGKPVMVKAQVMAGGRGKAGLILPADDALSVQKTADSLFGRVHSGERVNRLLIEKQIQIQQEAYVSIAMDYAAGMPVIMVSAQGGMDIENVAKIHPELLIKRYLDPFQPIFSHTLRELWRQAGFQGKQVVALEGILRKLIKVFYQTDAITAEINPLAITAEGDILAADAKLIVDDEALFRHQDILVVPRETAANVFEQRAKEINVTYVSLEVEGSIGIVAGGAGLSMATMDAIYAFGSKPAAFIDLGGGISRERMKEALSIMADTKGLQGLIINVFGGINNCLTMAQGISDFLKQKNPQFKIVVKMRGFEQEEGWEILENQNIPIIKYGTTDMAIRELIEHVREVKNACVS